MALKIYTKTGDKGTTALFGGTRVPKFSPRIEVYGTVDELNSSIGVTLSMVLPDDIRQDLLRLSSLLFSLGADLATPLNPVPTYAIPRIAHRDIQWVEGLIDRYEGELEPLTIFILPTGIPAAAALHVARTVCRRAERRAVELATEEDIGESIIPFLNRVSDYLFVAARLANKREGVGDVGWRNPSEYTTT